MTTKTRPITIRLDDETVERIDRQVHNLDRKVWEPEMTRSVFFRRAIYNELARCEANDKKEAA